MAITAPKKADAPGYVVLVPARAGKREGSIWHWQSNATHQSWFVAGASAHRHESTSMMRSWYGEARKN